MKPVTKRRLTKMTMLVSVLSAAGWSVSSYACPVEPYISSVCVMAVAGSQYAPGFDVYLPTNGQSVNVSNYQALYALIGTTYGGDTVQFKLPDLRGRVVVGVGTYAGPEGQMAYNVGQKGGAFLNALTASSLPAHVHTLGAGVAVTAGLGSMTVNVGLGSLGATTSLSTVTASAAGSGLTLNGTNAGTLGNSPANSALGTTTLASAKFYSDGAPNTAMKAGSITGTAPVTFSGTPSTTLSGSPIAALLGAPSVTVGGQTNVAGAGAAFSIMSPYLAMRYFIAAQGIWPSPN